MDLFTQIGDDMGIATTDEGMGQGLSMSANGTRIAMVTSAGVVVYAQDGRHVDADGVGRRRTIIPYTTYSGANRVDLSADGTRLIMSSREIESAFVMSVLVRLLMKGRVFCGRVRITLNVNTPLRTWHKLGAYHAPCPWL